MAEKITGTSMTIKDGSAVTRLIDLLGQNCPTEQVLREGVFNGIEANSRYSNDTGTVIITRDFEFENKLVIINYNGEYFSEEKARTHLNSLATSGNADNQSSDRPNNFGVGAKISYLPNNECGILYRSKGVGEQPIQFQIRKLSNGEYGLAEWEVEDDDGTYVAVCPTGFNSKLESADSGSEMVLMGNSESENTWLTLHNATKTGNASLNEDKLSGVPIINFLSLRLWDNLGSVVQVQKYVGGEYDSLATVDPLKESMQKAEDYGYLDLNVKDFGAVRAHYCRPKLGQGLKRDAYNVCFAWKSECYYDNVHHLTRSKRLRDCGIFTGEKDWFIVFEIPKDKVVYPNMTRTTLEGLDTQPFYQAFADNLPQVIKDWLSSQLSDSDSTTDLNDYLNDLFQKKSLKKKDSGKDGTKLDDTGKEKVKSAENGTGNGSGNSNNGKRNSSGKTRVRALTGSRNATISKAKDHIAPTVLLNKVDTDPDRFAQFDQNNYQVIVYAHHTLFNRKVDYYVDCGDYPNVEREQITQLVLREYAVGILEWLFSVYETFAKSESERVQRLDDNYLENSWSIYSDKEIRGTMSKLEKQAKALKECIEIA